jgi:hypothetical protein
MKKYQTTIIIEISDEKIEELKEENGDDIDNACYEIAQELALEMVDFDFCADGCRTYFADPILYVNEIN